MKLNLRNIEGAYIVDSKADGNDLAHLMTYLREVAGINPKELAYIEYKKVVDALKANGIADEDINDYIPVGLRYNDRPNTCYINSITLPETLATINSDILYADKIVLSVNAATEVLEAFYYNSVTKILVEAEEEPEKFADKFDDRLYCYSETEPIKNKKYYWHYVDGIPTLWENELK